MFDRSDVSDLVDRISHGVSCRLAGRGTTVAMLGAGLVLALAVIYFLVRRSRAEEEEVEDGVHSWDAETAPEEFPDTLSAEAEARRGRRRGRADATAAPQPA